MCSCCVVNTCCCGCCNVQYGSKVIAIVQISLAAAALVINLFVLQWGGIVSAILAILIGCLLLYGVDRHNRNLVLAWLVISFIIIAIDAVQAVAALVALIGIITDLSDTVAS